MLKKKQKLLNIEVNFIEIYRQKLNKNYQFKNSSFKSEFQNEFATNLAFTKICFLIGQT